MTEREFEQRLRTFYRNEVDATGRVPGELRDSVLAIPDVVLDRAGPFGPRRRFALLVAAMLTALLVGGAIAVGSGLLRLPWLREDRITTLAIWHSAQNGEGIPVACDQTLPDGLLLSVEPGLEYPALALSPWWLYLYDDGLLLRRDAAGLRYSVGWSQRHLSPDGVQRILAAVEGSGLRDCVGVPLAVPPFPPLGPGALPRDLVFVGELEIKGRTGDGVVAISLGSGGLRIVTPAELTAAAELADRLTDPDLGVPPSAWIEPDWQPYEPERWEIRISFEGGDGEGHQDGPWADRVLPDGSTFLTFGSLVPAEPEQPQQPRRPAYRCRVVGQDETEAMTAFLGEPAELEPLTNEGRWAFWDHNRGEGVAVGVSPLLRHEPGCAYEVDPPAPAPGGDLIDDLRVCDYLPETTLTWYRPEAHPDFGGGWAACSYPTGGWVFASRHKVSGVAALDLVEALFGIDGFTSDEIAGRTVYFNACVERYCSPAVAVSAEPHFVIVVPSEIMVPPEVVVRPDLQQLAESLIERLDDRTEP